MKNFFAFMVVLGFIKGGIMLAQDLPKKPSAALAPLRQSIEEYKAILFHGAIKDRFTGSRAVQSIEQEKEKQYALSGPKCKRLVVDIVPQDSQVVGPFPFNVRINEGQSNCEKIAVLDDGSFDRRVNELKAILENEEEVIKQFESKKQLAIRAIKAEEKGFLIESRNCELRVQVTYPKKNGKEFMALQVGKIRCDEKP